MRSGIFLIDKDPELSSAKIVAKIKHKFKLDKVGHLGTLDPFATGLLVIVAGDATRLMDYFMSGDKSYEGIFKFGLSTNTNDITGQIIKTVDEEPEAKLVIDFIDSFIGESEQLPPRVCANKINGKNAYELERKGIEFELKYKKVRINKFSLEPINKTEFFYKINCSKGTYIRSIARDLGEKVGIPCIVKTLCRTESYPFLLEKAKKFDQIEINDMLAWENFFNSDSKITVNDSEFERLRKGNLTNFITDKVNDYLIYFNSAGQTGGILKRENNQWKIFFNCRG